MKVTRPSRVQGNGFTIGAPKGLVNPYAVRKPARVRAPRACRLGLRRGPTFGGTSDLLGGVGFVRRQCGRPAYSRGNFLYNRRLPFIDHDELNP